MKKLGGSLLLCLILMACTPARDFVNVSRGASALASLSPQSLGHDLSLSQVVLGELIAAGASLRFELEITDDQLVLVGLNHAGIPVFTLKQDGQDVSYEGLASETPSFDADRLLTDVKMAYWPVEVLNLALGPELWRVSEREDGRGRRRSMLDANGLVIAEITYPQGELVSGELVLRRYDIPYRLRIQTLRAEVGSAA